MERDLSLFKKSNDAMISTNETSTTGGWWDYERTTGWRQIDKDLEAEKVKDILRGGDIEQMRALSDKFYGISLIYRRLLHHYATLLTYDGVLVPQFKPSAKPGKKFNDVYFNAQNFIDVMRWKEFCTEIVLRCMKYGAAFGVISDISKKEFSVIFLPHKYCRTRFKTVTGENVLEFNFSYFTDAYSNGEDRKLAVAAFPKEIRSKYAKYVKNGGDPWMRVSTDTSICFTFDDKVPFFVSIIDALLTYDDAVDIELERQIEDIKKILVQTIPHNTSTDALLFEPDEAEEMHRGAVGMLKKNKSVSVLTTYATATMLDSHTATEASNNNLETMMNNIFYQAGTNSSAFGVGGYSSFEASIQNDMSLLRPLYEALAHFCGDIVTRLFGNSNIQFTYTFLPISEYNRKDYVDNSFKLAQSGYSLLLPAIALGMSQKDFVAVKQLENDILDLKSMLLPPESSYTQSASGGDAENNDPKKTGAEGGAATEKAASEKTEQTTTTEESREAHKDDN